MLISMSEKLKSGGGRYRGRRFQTLNCWWASWLPLIAGLLACSSVWGATRVNLVIENDSERLRPTSYTQNQRWGLDGSPYQIEEQLTVESGVTLTIDPGVVVEVKGAYAIRVLGTLKATETSFAAFDGGAWRGIYLGPDAGSSVIDACTISGTSVDQAILNGRWVRAAVYVDHCSPTLRQLEINVPSGNGIELYQSDAVITGNRISVGSEGHFAIRVETLDSFPVLADNAASGVGRRGVRVSGGNLGRSGEWSNPGAEMPYVVTGALELNSGTTLSIAPGTTLDMTSQVWRVFGTLMVNGTMEAPVRFTGPWSGFYFGETSSGSQIKNAVINDAGAADLGIFNGTWRRASVYVDHASPRFENVSIQRSGRNGFELHQSSPTITHCVITEAAAHGLVARAGSRPTLAGTEFVRNGSEGFYTVWMDASSVPVPANLTFIENHRSGIQVGGGMMTAATRWQSWDPQAPYVITGNVSVELGVRWELDPGVVVKVQSSALRVDGTLHAVGSETQPIVFSSAKDDSVAGDSNGDGTETVPAPGDWKGIHLSPLSVESQLSHVGFRYSGGDSLGIINGTWRHTTLYLEQTDPLIENVSIRDSRGDGIELYQSAATIHDCEFIDMGADRYAIQMISAVSFPDLQGNTGSGQGTIGVALPVANVENSGRTTRAGEQFFYYPLGDLSLNEDVAWTLDPGVELWFGSGKLSVFGSLQAEGEDGLPVRFRSRSAEPAAGQWKGVYFSPTSSGSVLNNLEVWHAGGSDLGIYHGTWRQAALYLDNSQARIQNLLVAESGHNGVELVGASPLFRNVTFQDCRRFALVARDHSRPVLENALFRRNGAMGHYTVWTDPTSVPNPNGVEFVENTKTGIEVVQGTIAEETLWEHWGSGAPYVITGVVTVAPETLLNVESGAVLKFGATRLMVEGTLVANGEDGRITFTSLSDDTIGGDTNGDVAESAPTAGDWQGIYLGPGAGESQLRHCDFHYAGRDSLGIINGTWRQATIYVNQCAPLLTHNFISDSGGHGLELFSSDAILRHNQIQRVANGRYPILFGNLDCFPQLIGNQAEDNAGYGIGLSAGSIARSGFWMEGGFGLPYQPLGDVALPAEFELTVAPGTRFETAGHRLSFDGALYAQGTADHRVTFNGRQVGENFHGWKGVYFGPGASGSVVDFVDIRDAGVSDLGILDGTWRRASLYVAGGAPELRHLSIIGGGGNGIELSGTEALFEDVLIAGHSRGGVEIRGDAVPQLVNLTIVNNGANGISTATGSLALVNSIVAFNGGSGLSLQTVTAFDEGRIRHNLFHGNTGGDGLLWDVFEPGGLGGNLDDDPLFSDAAQQNYQLSAASPAVDAGVERDPHGLDLLGKIRWFGESVDLGAYEQNAAEPNYGVDLAVREAGTEMWLGQGTSAEEEQSLTVDIPFGEVKHLEFRYEYTGNLPGSVTLTTELPAPGWHLEIHLLGVEGETNVTPAWFANDGYPVGQGVPGEVVDFEFRLSAREDVEVTPQWNSQVTALSQSGERDRLWLEMALVQPPRITEQPLAQSVTEGEGVSLGVVADGLGELRYQWYRNGNPVAGATMPSFVLSGVTLAHAGEYFVEVSNEDGTVRSAVAFLEVIEKPIVEPAPFVIEQQPETLLVDEFAEAIFSVAVTGEAPFTYQWYRDELPICGETDPVFRIAAARLSQQAVYWVEIVDALGRQATSQKEAELIVEASGKTEEILFDNNNIGAVQNEPTAATSFVLEESAWLTQIETYHWNSAQGKALGTIGLEDEQGVFYGPWEATGRCGQGGVLDAYWSVFPDVELAPGHYTIIDSDAASWSHNGESAGRGFAVVRGVFATSVPPTGSSIVEATGWDGDWRLTGDAEWFAQSTETFSPGTAMQSGAITRSQRSAMELTVNGPGMLSFAWKVSSEAPDPLIFRIDGVEMTHIDLEVPWQELSFPLRWGERVLTWEYVKDGSVDSGADAGWVDDVRFEPVSLYPLEEVLPDAPGPMTMTGSAPWFGQGDVLYEGQATAQTGNIGHNETSRLSVSVFGPGWLRFAWKVSAETADPFMLVVDDVELGRISGDTDWRVEERFLRWGEHTINFDYVKDVSVSSLADAGWLSNLQFEAVPLVDLDVALDQPELDWTTGPEAPWFGQAQVGLTGGAAVQSGNIGARQTTDLQTTLEGPAILAFRWKASSENPDFGSFLIDDVAVTTIRGETEWVAEAFALDPGLHSLTWRYQKDISVDHAADAVFLDEVSVIRGVPGVDELPLEILPDPGNGLQQYRGSIGRVLLFRVTGTASGSLWGTDIYTDDSVLAKAAVHAGVLEVGEEGIVVVTILPGQGGYSASDRNGIVSSGYGTWGGSFQVQALGAEALEPPNLSIRNLGDGRVEVSWPQRDDGWTLVTTSSLDEPDWVAVDGTASLDSDRMGVVLSIDAFSRFFQLIR